MRRTILLAIAALVACGQAGSAAQQASTPTEEQAIELGSRVDDIRIVAATKLPANPDRGHIDEYCSDLGFGMDPKSPGGRMAATNQWIVTSETKLGKYDAVSLVGALLGATSGTCAHKNGNLAIFEGSQLKAIAYIRPKKQLEPDDLIAVDSLGFSEQINQRRVRLHWGLPSPPFGDVVLRDGIFVEPTAPKDSVCGGAAAVPNVFGEEIREARKKLRSYGWVPQRPDPEEGMTGGEYLVRQGIIEVEACSGTGYGFCAYNYRHRKGFGLRIISMGEEYRVRNYEAHCGNER